MKQTEELNMLTPAPFRPALFSSIKAWLARSVLDMSIETPPVFDRTRIHEQCVMKICLRLSEHDWAADLHRSTPRFLARLNALHANKSSQQRKSKKGKREAALLNARSAGWVSTEVNCRPSYVDAPCFDACFV